MARHDPLLTKTLQIALIPHHNDRHLVDRFAVMGNLGQPARGDILKGTTTGDAVHYDEHICLGIR